MKVFGSKCYILKETRKDKFDVKVDEGIFLGYSSRSKAYKHLKPTTHKIIKCAHVKIDEFVEKSEEESNKVPKDYKIYVCYDPDALLNPSIS